MKKTLGIAVSFTPTLALMLLIIVVGACSSGAKSSDKITEGIGEEPSSNPTDEELRESSNVLTLWQAGKTVTPEEIELYGGIDKCFSLDTIPENIWLSMQGKSYQENPYIQRDDLRYIRALHWDYDQKIHVGEMIVNTAIAERVVSILRQLYDAQYPIAKMILTDNYEDDEAQMRDNNSSGFCYRNVARTGKLSKHARGLAVDINTLYNPYYKVGPDGTRFIQPSNAGEYCDRSKDFPYKIDHDDLCYKLFSEAGFRWGGDFRSCKDYQHFEFLGGANSNTSNNSSYDTEGNKDTSVDDTDDTDDIDEVPTPDNQEETDDIEDSDDTVGTIDVP